MYIHTYDTYLHTYVSLYCYWKTFLALTSSLNLASLSSLKITQLTNLFRLRRLTGPSVLGLVANRPEPQKKLSLFLAHRS